VTPRRGIQLLPKRRSGDARVSLAALMLQVVVIAGIASTVIVPVASNWLRSDAQPIVAEAIRFEVVFAPTGAGSRGAARDGGDGRPIDESQPVAEPSVVPPLVAPSTVPTGVPAAPASEPAIGGGYGDILGDPGPVRGLRPSYSDPRLWGQPGDVSTGPVVPMTRADTLRRLLERGIEAYVDALERTDPNARQPGDWTFNLGGKKWGLDRGMIRLGNFSLPAAVLGALPLNNVQANPIVGERVARLDAMRREILEQSARQMRDDEFDRAVKALRERREKERQAMRAAQEAQRNPPLQATNPDRPERP
jgi:hypothetical protein